MSRKQRIEHHLMHELTPVYLEVHNESHQHHVPEGSQTHFNVIAVSEKFTGLSRVARHRLINHLLSQEFTAGLHALSLHLYDPREWEKNKDAILNSPVCKGGLHKEKGSR